ncbi:MAG: Asp-tRNA(Asn)/Glu-tRNA(Gln) amidotransferase subunit GatC [Candidatus Nanoarchaeia archaeon]|nr:Asp-tRNA(Asn)/Glu-tRNA(Gln) amidotransferase subunit GatC [Candidatus Nanoarchaeia archaeon]
MIDEKTVEHIAKASRLELSSDEIKKFSKQFSDILKEFEVIDEVDTGKINPCFHPVETKNVMSEDRVTECLSTKQALSMTEHKENGFFRGPKII